MGIFDSLKKRNTDNKNNEIEIFAKNYSATAIDYAKHFNKNLLKLMYVLKCYYCRNLRFFEKYVLMELYTKRGNYGKNICRY